MPFSYTDIARNRELDELMQDFTDRKVTKLAMDFEGEFNLHVYGERLCLIQVFDGENFYLVDPLTIDPDRLSRFLTMKNMLYIFFSADSDRSLAYKKLGVKMLSVYDVQHLVEVLDLPKKGLDAVLESELGVVVENKKRYQRQNWIRRPIEEGAKQYALGDVAHLFDLHEKLLEKVKTTGLEEELIFKLALSTKDFDKKTVPGIFKTPAYKKMNRTKKNLYEKIVAVREACAEELDLPAHMVIPKQELVSLTDEPGRIRRLRFAERVPVPMRNRIIAEISALG